MAGDNPSTIRKKRSMPQTRMEGRGPSRGTERDTSSTVNVNPITGPGGSIPGGPNLAPMRRRVQAEERAFVKKGSQATGTMTARQTGARALAIRHFEEATRAAQQVAAYRRRKATI